MKKILVAATACLVVLTFPALAQSPPDFSRVVALGDSLTAGFWNGSLNERGQVNSYAVLVTRQAGGSLALPLISYPGIPIALKLEGYDPATGLPIIGFDGTAPGELENPAQQPANLAVPGQTSVDCLGKVPAAQPSSLTDLILGFPGVYIEQREPLSQVGLARELDPTFIFLWIGSNDVLGAALAGDPSYVVPASVFEQTYPAILQSLSETGAKLVLANIPDVTIIPALTKGQTLKLLGIDLKKLGIKNKDYVTPAGLAHLELILKGVDPGPLTAGEVLTASEAKTIQAVLKQDNKLIAKLGQQYKVPVVDIYGEFGKISKTGYVLPSGQLITTAFLGGIFSLDGVHPTNAGQAIVANDFIDAMNKSYGTQLAHVEVPPPTADDLGTPSQEGVVVTGPDGKAMTLATGGLNLPAVPREALAPILPTGR